MSKRNQRLYNNEEFSKKIKVDELQEIRVLVQNSEAGIIIGKGGSNVKKIRNDTGGFISFLKNEIPGCNERVMVLKGLVVANVNVMQYVANLLIGADESGVDTCVVKILIPKSQSGCIIGKGGTIIREMQTETGALLHLSTEALGNSTERELSITATPEMIEAVCLRVFTQLNDNPIRIGTQHIPYVPGASGASEAGASGASSFTNGSANNGAVISQKRTEKIVIPTICKGFVLGKGGVNVAKIRALSNVAKISLADPESSTPDELIVSITGQPAAIKHAVGLIRGQVDSYKDQTTGEPLSGFSGVSKVYKIVIPTEAAGYVIGKGGSFISDIRTRSFVSKISVAEPSTTAPHERVVTITGNLENVSVATELIQARVALYKPK